MSRLMVIWVCVVLLFSGCKKEQLDDCFQSTGDDVTIERLLDDFREIEVGDKFQVILEYDSVNGNRVEITGGEHVLEGISTEVQGGILTIANTNRCNFVRSFKRLVTVHVYLKELSHITMTGAATISCIDTLRLDSLHIDHSALEDLDLTIDCAGQVYVESINSGATFLRGQAFKLAGSIEEITNLDARDLVCTEVLLDSHSPLPCYINGTKLIYVGIFGNGNIYYVTEPTERKEVRARTGEGQLLKLVK